MLRKETSRLRFIDRVTAGEEPVTELCRQSGISRKTGYKLIHRYAAHGEEGLLDRSRAPHDHPNATPRELAERIVEAKCAHPTWGPKKLIPGCTTYALAGPQHRGRHPGPRGACAAPPREAVAAPPPGTNPRRASCPTTGASSKDRRRDARRSPHRRRYLIACQGLERPTGPETRRALARAFQEYGLATTARSPASAWAPLGLSAWWIKLGIGAHRAGTPRTERASRAPRTKETAATPRGPGTATAGQALHPLVPALSPQLAGIRGRGHRAPSGRDQVESM